MGSKKLIFRLITMVVVIAIACQFSSCLNDDETFEVGEDPSSVLISAGLHLVEGKVRGDGNYTVILLPGFDDTFEIWDEQAFVDTLAKKYQVIAFSRGGYGRSQDGPETKSLENLTDELAGVINVAALHDVVLVGNEFGGMIARSFAVRYPEQVAALLLLDPPVRICSA